MKLYEFVIYLNQFIKCGCNIPTTIISEYINKENLHELNIDEYNEYIGSSLLELLLTSDSYNALNYIHNLDPYYKYNINNINNLIKDLGEINMVTPIVNFLKYHMINFDNKKFIDILTIHGELQFARKIGIFEEEEYIQTNLPPFEHDIDDYIKLPLIPFNTTTYIPIKINTYFPSEIDSNSSSSDSSTDSDSNDKSIKCSPSVTYTLKISEFDSIILIMSFSKYPDINFQLTQPFESFNILYGGRREHIIQRCIRHDTIPSLLLALRLLMYPRNIDKSIYEIRDEIKDKLMNKNKCTKKIKKNKKSKTKTKTKSKSNSKSKSVSRTSTPISLHELMFKDDGLDDDLDLELDKSFEETNVNLNYKFLRNNLNINGNNTINTILNIKHTMFIVPLLYELKVTNFKKYIPQIKKKGLFDLLDYYFDLSDYCIKKEPSNYTANKSNATSEFINICKKYDWYVHTETLKKFMICNIDLISPHKELAGNSILLEFIKRGKLKLLEYALSYIKYIDWDVLIKYTENFILYMSKLMIRNLYELCNIILKHSYKYNIDIRIRSYNQYKKFIVYNAYGKLEINNIKLNIFNNSIINDNFQDIWAMIVKNKYYIENETYSFGFLTNIYNKFILPKSELLADIEPSKQFIRLVIQ